jgi:hypothetical protein
MTTNEKSIKAFIKIMNRRDERHNRDYGMFLISGGDLRSLAAIVKSYGLKWTGVYSD